MVANVAALAQRAPGSPSLARYRELNDLLAHGSDAAQWVADLTAALAIPKLAALGVKRDELPLLVERAKAASSMRGNPIALDDDELTAIARAALD
jgi:alcohol dehydrogenase class IV